MNRRRRNSAAWGLFLLGIAAFVPAPRVDAGESSADPGEELQIEVTKRGLGKQVVISQGAREWFMLIDVTPEHSVIIRQEKDQAAYLVDESETHDRPMTQGEVDAAIVDYVDSVKTRVKKR
jgi:hypothetical protein